MISPFTGEENEMALLFSPSHVEKSPSALLSLSLSSAAATFTLNKLFTSGKNRKKKPANRLDCIVGDWWRREICTGAEENEEARGNQLILFFNMRDED